MGEIFCDASRPADVTERWAPPAGGGKAAPMRVMAYGIAGYASWTSWVNMAGNHWPAAGESGSEFVA